MRGGRIEDDFVQEETVNTQLWDHKYKLDRWQKKLKLAIKLLCKLRINITSEYA